MRTITLLCLAAVAALSPAMLFAGEPTQTTSALAVITIPDAEELQVFNAGGQDVVINGCGNRIIITGRCGTLTVNGDANYVTVQSVSNIVVMGSLNKVRWNNGNTETAPANNDKGRQNNITHPGG